MCCLLPLPMQDIGKCQHQRVIATNSAGPNACCCMFFVCDKVSGHHFMMDNGAELSVIPPSLTFFSSLTNCRNLNPSFTLQAANKTSISMYSWRFLSLNFGLHRNFSFVFVIADISTALLGTNFLGTFDLKVDICQSHLKDHTTGLCIQGRLSTCSPLDLHICHLPSCPGFADLNHYLQLLHSSSSSSEVRHDIMHHIHTSGPPVFTCPHHLGPKKLATTKAEFEHMLQLGIIRHWKAAGPHLFIWSQNPHLGDWHSCLHFEQCDST